jgi:hypothetical protein
MKTEPFDFTQWIGYSQRAALRAALRGEERDAFRELLADWSATIAAMPHTYETDGMGETAVAELHYFSPGGDWYITEKDIDTDGAGQLQAFGLADPFGDGGELGYISIPELLAAGVEFDLHWNRKPLAELRAAKQPAHA